MYICTRIIDLYFKRCENVYISNQGVPENYVEVILIRFEMTESHEISMRPSIPLLIFGN